VVEPTRSPIGRPTAVVFDLDGTILDSSSIICAAMSVTAGEFGHPHPPEVFRPYVGPPPWHTFGEVTGEPAEVVARIVPRYREIYGSMMAATPVFPGVREVIDDLAARGMPMAVATSKLRSAAITLLDGAGLADRFVTIQGAGHDAASAAKDRVIGRALTDLRAAGVDTSALLMVGDRRHDVEGALVHGILTILVGWGYAGPGEEQGAAAVADTPLDLLALLFAS
jgi:phosphoglycolate phosphatase